MRLVDLSKTSIVEIQEKLKKLKFYNGAIDGICGPQTLKAFNLFKVAYHLTEPDMIGETTKKVLDFAVFGSVDNTESEPPKRQQPHFEKAQAIQREIDWNNFNCPISKYFTVGEVSQWSMQRIVPITLRTNVLSLAVELDKIREDWGSGLGVTSWYRPISVNKRVGGVPNSTHIKGIAADIYPLKGSVLSFEKWLDSRWQRALGYGAKKGFVHLDMRDSPSRIRWKY